MDTKQIWKYGSDKEKTILNFHIKYVVLLTRCLFLLAVITISLMCLNPWIQFMFYPQKYIIDSSTVCYVFAFFSHKFYIFFFKLFRA